MTFVLLRPARARPGRTGEALDAGGGLHGHRDATPDAANAADRADRVALAARWHTRSNVVTPPPAPHPMVSPPPA